jgi:type 1 glutamine amidotransferase
MDPSPRGTARVLATVDESTFTGGTMGLDHPVSWCHNYDGGRAWFTTLGHSDECYAEPLFRAHLLGAIQWAATGGPTCVSQWTSYR